MKYSMKIDSWVKSTFIITTGALLLSMAFIPNEGLIYYSISVVPIVILTLWMLMGSYYELRDEELFMRIGPIYGKVPYENIKSISLDNNWSSSWAMSIKRVNIKVHNKKWYKGDVQVGPKEREEFMDDLRRRCRNLD